MLQAISNLISNLIGLYAFCFIVRAVIEMLLHFNVIRGRSLAISKLYQFLFRLTEPILKHIRAILPKSLEIDLSPLVVLLALYFLQDVIKGFIWPL